MADKGSISFKTLTVASLLGLACGYVVFAQSGRGGVAQRSVDARPPLENSEQATISLFKASAPSVVFINTQKEAMTLSGRMVEVPVGTGSGYVWDDEGHIVTNFHVVADVASGQTSATVAFNGDERYPAELIGVAPEHDIAVLKITPNRPLQPLPIGQSSDLQVGQEVLAIGNPFGLDHTLTVGIVSAIGRTIPTPGRVNIEDAIQTDAAINPGNSGGPLLDSAGRLIGMNTAIFSPSGSSVGIGFAIPVDTINRIVPQLIQYGMAERAILGVGVSDRMSQEIGRQLGVSGVVVVSVAKGSAAEAAGLRPARLSDRGVYVGDVITQIDGKPVSNNSELDQILFRHKPGDTVAVSFWRDGKTESKKLMLDSSIRLRQ